MYVRVLPSWIVGIKMQNLHVQLQSHTVGVRESYTTTLRPLLPAQVISTKQNTALRHQCYALTEQGFLGNQLCHLHCLSRF